MLFACAVLLLVIGAVGFLWPRVLLAMPVVLLAGYVGLALLWRALRLRLGRKPKLIGGVLPHHEGSIKAALRSGR